MRQSGGRIGRSGTWRRDDSARTAADGCGAWSRTRRCRVGAQLLGTRSLGNAEASMNIYPFSLFARASDGEAMTPWERAQRKFWQYLAYSMGVFVLANLDKIQAALSGTGTNFWEQVHTQIFVPFVVALV